MNINDYRNNPEYKPKPFDINTLLQKALNNETNENIMKLDKNTVSKQKNDILQQLGLSRIKLKEIHKNLKDYRYVNDLSDLNYGCFIRWINIKNPDKELKLTNGGFVVDFKLTDKGLLIQCRNILNNKRIKKKYSIFHFYYDECIIFQKLTQQEEVLLEVIDYLGGSNKVIS